MILVRSDLDFSLKSINLDSEGRSIIMEAEVQGSLFLFVNIYAPNRVQDQCHFFENLNKNIEDFVVNKEHRIIVGGDFNVTLDSDLDCSGGKPFKKESVKQIQDLCLDFDLVDIWRIRNPESKRFTWRQKNPFIQRRLDYWLINDTSQDDIEKSDIIPSINSDHSAIFLQLNSLDKPEYGPSFWKFNASLTDDDDFVKLINESVPMWLKEFDEVTDKILLWDFIKYRIRQASIKYSKEKALKKRKKISDLETSLRICEEKCNESPTFENKERLEMLKMEYDSIYEQIAKGAIIRSKATWYEKGEKSNKYFLNLETYKKAKSSVRKVFNDEGVLITDPKKILQEIQNFYSNLCKRDPLRPSEDMLNSFLNNSEIPKLTNNEARICEGKLTVDECYRSLQLFENNKSPGNDGLTVEFYRAFWQTLGNLMVDSLNYSYDYGELSNSQKEAIITLIEKKDKDKRNLSNWRPISLINVDVKIGSKAIAKRLENVLPNIIHYNQCAYVKGRTIFDAVRTIEDVMEFSERYNLEGRMICIDFKKAFDTVSRDFLFRTLIPFGFGPSFLKWIYTFYNNISSCVINNGFSTQPFPVERGVRQGDPLSAYLFIIVLEILCISIRNSKDICGIKVDNEEIKLSLFADDLTGFLKDNRSLVNFLKLIQDYGSCSGLKINHDKSEIMLLGNCAYTPQQVSAVSSNLKIKKVVKILGVHFTYDLRVKQKLNVDELISSIQEKLRIWRWRDLTIIGRIQIVKIFIIPIFLYRASLISVNREFVKDVNKIIFDFIWKGKDKVKRFALISDIEDGGLKAPHLDSIIETQRVLCCKKLASDQPSNWKKILLHYLEPVGGKFILCCDFDLKKLPVKLPAFYEECLKSFAKCSAANHLSVQDQSRQDLSKAIIWNNKFICIDGKSVYLRNLAEKGILRMRDLISNNNELIVKSSYKLRELNFSPLDTFKLISVIDALPVEWRESLNTLAFTADEPFTLHNEIKLNFNGKNALIETVVSKTRYRELRNRFITPPTAQLNFNTHFVNDVLEWKEIYSLPFRTSLDTKLREFQYKLLNRCLVTNSFLNKIGVIPSPACSFCGELNESLEHFFYLLSLY